MSRAKTASQEEVPKPLRGEMPTQQIIREQIWRPAARKNDWSVFVVVGREGSGKSLTCASILKACDPTFNIDRAHFRPVPFLEDIGRETGKPGLASQLDEAGVAFGNRTWQDRTQVKANQYLQTARDDNRIIGLTLPRMEELDSQLEGRVHAIAAVQKKKDGDWVEMNWKTVDPSREGQSKLYKKWPRIINGGRRQKVTGIRVGAPPNSFIENYLPKKAQWKASLQSEVVGKYRDEFDDGEDGDGDGLSLDDPKGIAQDIMDQENIGDYVGEYNNRVFIDDDLIGLDYDVGDRKAGKVKKLIEREIEVEEYA